MDIRGKKLVVIGGAGLIGSHTIDLLLREDVEEVVIFDNFVRGSMENLEDALKDPRVSIFEAGGDIRDFDILNKALKGVDGVFDFAALWLLQCQDYPRAAFQVNIQGSFNVFEACIENGISRYIYSSSASVYGDAVEEPMTEDHPFNNTNFYGATKIASEAMVKALHHRYGLPYVGMRFMNVYGPRQCYSGAYSAVFMRMLDRIDNNEPILIFGDGTQAYDFVYVNDCARATICAMKADTVDRFYNVSTGRKTTINELANILLEITGSDVGIEYKEERQSFVRTRVGCTRRSEEEIGFVAKTDLRAGLLKLIDWRARHKAENENLDGVKPLEEVPVRVVKAS